MSLVAANDDNLPPEHVRAGKYVLLEGAPHWFVPRSEAWPTLHACYPGDLWTEAPEHLAWEEETNE